MGTFSQALISSGSGRELNHGTNKVNVKVDNGIETF